jgi:NAD(P)-dependent dehydrogenase (short-subunit alcohol dehydrogenase family)
MAGDHPPAALRARHLGAPRHRCCDSVRHRVTRLASSVGRIGQGDPVTTSGTVLGPDSTTDEVLDGVDLSGTTVLVTGGSGGLGLETVRALAVHGAHVIATGRDVPRAEAAVEGLGLPSGAVVDVEELDLASLDSVRAAADRIGDRYDSLDVLVANAGVMACPQGRTADGFETQFGTNHLGHFLFVNRLVPLLVSGAASRVVVLTSAGHRFDDIDLDDVQIEATPYTPFLAYHRAKTANILFAVELDRRHRADGLRACAVHPGTIDDTGIQRHLGPEAIARMHAHRRHTKTIASGAATSVWAAVVADADAIGGGYAEDCHVSPVSDIDPMTPEGRTGVRSYAIDPARSARLWAISEELVGEGFP